MLLVATLYYASRPQRSSSRGKIYPCKTQTTDNQISPSGKLDKVCKQVANHAIYNLSTTFMVEVTGLEPAASASRTQRSTKLSHASMPKHYTTHQSEMQAFFSLSFSFFRGRVGPVSVPSIQIAAVFGVYLVDGLCPVALRPALVLCNFEQSVKCFLFTSISL